MERNGPKVPIPARRLQLLEEKGHPNRVRDGGES